MAPRFRLAAPSLCLTLALAACDQPTTVEDEPPVPTSLRVLLGESQTGEVGLPLPIPLLVQVADAAGAPMANVPVGFRVVTGGGQVDSSFAITPADGTARSRWTLGSKAGDQHLEIRAVAVATGALLVDTLVARGMAGAPKAALLVSGNNQEAAASSALADSLTVRVEDRFQNPVENALVRWSVPAGGGSVGPASARTRADGVAKAAWTLGREVGTTQTAMAEVDGIQVAFNAKAGLPAGATLTLVAGGGQTAAPGAMLADSLVVEVAAAGRPVPGALVRWSIKSGGGSILPLQGRTGADGRARARWTLGAAEGEQIAQTSLDGSSETVDAKATAVAPPPPPPPPPPLVTYQDIVMGDGPIAYWRLNETSGDLMVDRAGGHNGTYTGGAEQGHTLGGRLGTAVRVRRSHPDGVYVPFGAWMNTTRVSVEAWIRPEVIGSPDGGLIVDKGNAWQLLLDTNGRLAFGFAAGARATAPNPVALDEVYHVVGTFESRRLRLYVNGALVAESLSAPGSIPVKTEDLHFGRGLGALTWDYAGLIDEVAIYAVELSPEQVAEHYSLGR